MGRNMHRYKNNLREIKCLTNLFCRAQVAPVNWIKGPAEQTNFSFLLAISLQCSSRTKLVKRSKGKEAKRFAENFLPFYLLTGLPSLCSYLPFPIYDKFGGRELCKAHRAKRMNFRGADADFRAKPQLVAVIKAG